MIDTEAVRQEIDDVLADIDAALDLLPPVEDGDIRLTVFAEHWGVSENGAKGRLRKLEPERGRLLLVQVRPGVRATVWRPAR